MPTILRPVRSIGVDVGEYRALYRRSRQMRPEIRREMNRRLRDAAKIGQRAARLKIRAMPATARYSKTGAGRHYRKRRPGDGVGLRSTLALNIKVSITARDVAIRQFTAGLRGRNARNLPKVIDRGGYGIRGGWRHPVYGHEPEVFQRSWPYFASEIGSKKREMTREVAKTLHFIQVELAKSSVRHAFGRAA